MAEFVLSTSKDGITRSPERQRTARRRIKELQPPSAASLDLADDLARRVYNRTAQIRRGFVARADPRQPAPPAAEILRSGRGNMVRLKLYLSILWIAAGAPHSVSASAQAWATLLDIDDPAGKGARQVRSGLRWLEAHQLVRLSTNRGSGSTVTLLSDLGTGDAYSVPGQGVAKALEGGSPLDRRDLYVKLPDTFWTRGWIQLMSAPAVAMLLALMDARRGAAPDRELWFSERVAEERYTLVEETRAKGFAELAALGLVDMRVRAIKSDALGAPRLRYVYSLDLSRLNEYAIEGMDNRPEVAL